jgi:RND family efflux transporter MFP subunit
MPIQMSSLNRLAVLMVGLLAAVLITWIAAAGPAMAQVPQDMLVRVEKVRTEPFIQTVPIVGRLVSLRMGDIAARISAPVESIQIEVGDHVTKGQVMAVLDAEILQAELNLAQSELDEAGAELKTWAAELDVAKTELRRQEGLRTSVAFSQAKFEDAQKKVVVAEARVERARANVAIKRSNLERKQIDVEYTAVRAPYAGVVMRRYTEVGAYVKKGDPVVRVIGDQSLEVEAFIPTKRLNGLSIGRKVEFKLDDGTRHHARVRSILPSENTQTRTRIVRLVPEFGKTKRPLAESQSVVVNVPISEDRRVVTVHKDAILKRPSGDIVYVVIKDVAQMRTVVLGEALGSRFEVMSGLKEGEVVVIRGNERLQPGTKVRIGKGSS